MSAHPTKIHPLVAVAAGSVIVVSLVGTAAIMDWLPGSHSDDQSPQVVAAAEPAPAAAPAPSAARSTSTAANTAPPPPKRSAPPKPAAAAPAPAAMPAAAPAAMPAPPPVAAKAPVCELCGKVVDVRSVEVAAKPSGVGVVAGAVVGGLLGNQVGGGSGKTLATVAGAVGGGYAGNEIEKRTRKAAAYEVDVMMESGERRSFSFEAQPSWRAGDRVRVVDGQLAAR